MKKSLLIIFFGVLLGMFIPSLHAAEAPQVESALSELQEQPYEIICPYCQDVPSTVCEVCKGVDNENNSSMPEIARAARGILVREFKEAQLVKQLAKQLGKAVGEEVGRRRREMEVQDARLGFKTDLDMAALCSAISTISFTLGIQKKLKAYEFHLFSTGLLTGFASACCLFHGYIWTWSVPWREKKQITKKFIKTHRKALGVLAALFTYNLFAPANEVR